MNEREFMETMAALVTAAAANENRVSEAEIRAAFDRMELSEEQYGMICEYLKTNRILVESEASLASALPDAETLFGGFAEEEEAVSEKPVEGSGEESPQEMEMFESIAQSAEQMERFSAERLRELAEELGDLSLREKARNLLAEQYLPKTVELAREYGKRGAVRCDLVQEGCIAVLLALESYEGGSLEQYLETAVRRRMEDFVQSAANEKSLGEKLTGRANRLMELSAELCEELGREATPAELAEKLGLSEEEVRDIMKISLDAMSVLEAEGGDAGDFLPNSENQLNF